MLRRTLLCALLMLAACGSEPPSALRVGAVSYAESQLLGISESRRRSLADLAAFGQAVADSSTMELGRPLIDEWLDDRRLEILAAELSLEKNGVGDDVLEAQYLLDPQWELVVRHILFFSERWRSADHRAGAAEKAERAMESLRGGADFAVTAAELSEEPGAEGRQGLLTPGREGSWVPEFWAAALALQPGEISPVTETQYGYHILRLEDRSVVPFNEARSVQARLVAARVEDPAAVLADWMSTASSEAAEARSAALAEADRRGIVISEGERVEVERGWDDIAYRFAITFGFRYGASAAQVGEAALAALSNPAQGVSLARTDLAKYREVLDRRHPPRFGTDPQ
jgi:parvulin-like peptidyl-prolyl isomerase